MWTHIHFIGISGISMGGLAKYIQIKYPHINITGHTNIEDYSMKNILINGDLKTFIHDISVCVVSSSIKENHPELSIIKAHNIPVIHRSNLLNILTKNSLLQQYLSKELITLNNERIAVVGAHGKTSITTYLHQLLGALKPTTFLGGLLKNGESFAIGGNDLYIIESDESDKSFLNLSSTYTIIPNLDDDHLENYNNSYEEYLATFEEYMIKIKNKNSCVIYYEDNFLKDMLQKHQIYNISYGIIGNNVNIEILETIDMLKWKLHTDLPLLNSINQRIFEVKMIGLWNIYNITAAIIMATIQKIPVEDYLHLYKPDRRCEIIYQQQDTIIIDDYGVHPTEIAHVLDAYLQKYSKDDLYVIWQPHRLTRLRALKDKFKEVFSKINSNNLFYTPIYEVDNHTPTEEWKSHITYGLFINYENISNLLKNLKGKKIILFNAGNLHTKIKDIIKSW